MEGSRIDGHQWLRDRAEVRRKIARIKRNKINDLKQQMNEDGFEKNRWYWKIRRRVIEHNIAEAPAKYTPANADELKHRALNLLISSHKPCPPLPCGADDVYIENQYWDRFQAFKMLDAYAVLRTRDAHRNAPNIHAFDEQYFGDD
tara:strand:+ start:293 stop:730 length:438 start_codon:yes stop_codon:yes gene_type:complete